MKNILWICCSIKDYDFISNVRAIDSTSSSYYDMMIRTCLASNCSMRCGWLTVTMVCSTAVSASGYIIWPLPTWPSTQTLAAHFNTWPVMCLVSLHADTLEGFGEKLSPSLGRQWPFEEVCPPLAMGVKWRVHPRGGHFSQVLWWMLYEIW